MLEASKIMAFIATADAARALSFYEGILGLTLVADEEYALVFDAGGTELRLQKVAEVTPAKYTWLGWHVDDITDTVDALTGKGVTFERYPGMGQDDLGIWSVGGAKVAWFKDPDGNLLSLAQ